MTAFVLVHGAWGGGWYWVRVARHLRAAGHEVFTTPLSGLGERAHLLAPDVGLSLHIEDILAVLEHERLTDIVLVGHSYGGMVVSGFADRVPERIRSLVYLDAALPESGQAMIDLVLPERRAQLLESARARGEGWKIPPIPAAQWSIEDHDDRRWLDELCGFQPLKAMTDPSTLRGRHLGIANKYYILAASYRPSSFEKFAARTRNAPGWTNYDLPTSHFTMVQMPTETADLLLRCA